MTVSGCTRCEPPKPEAAYPVVTFRKEAIFIVDNHVYAFDHDVELALTPNHSELPRIDSITVRPGYASVVVGVPGEPAPKPHVPRDVVILTVKVPPA